MAVPIWLGRYIGLPFKEHGRDRSGLILSEARQEAVIAAGSAIAGQYGFFGVAGLAAQLS